MSEVIYFDSCTFLAWLKDEVGRADVITQLFDEANNGRLKIVTSTLTIAEVLDIQGFKNPIPVEDRDAVNALFKNEWIIPKGVIGWPLSFDEWWRAKADDAKDEAKWL